MSHNTMRAVLLLLGLFCRLYARTLRITMILPDGTSIRLRQYALRRVIFAHSETIDLGISPALLQASFVILLAPGRDGDRAEKFLTAVGCKTVRGSSTRAGTTGLRRLIRILREHQGPAALAVDGPKGPRGTVKPGIISCAFHTGRPIIPLGAAARPCWVFRRSWSQIFLPLPGARVVIVSGADFNATVPFDRAAVELADRLKLAQERAESLIRS